ncbi:MAG: hypothetical protein KIT72_09170 [Polyangiaceae bacterium]|nr:hypothetical protein [Polyangiaceae bacterium]MCW5790579.1 hypothetical protein [Polyangiaceae bacterium]
MSDRQELKADVLRAERDALKESLKAIEVEQRKLDAELKAVRQRELRAKRQIEALNTLIELSDEPTDAPSE